MSSDMQHLTPFDSFGDSDQAAYLARNDQPGGDLGSKIHRSLRGRYWLIVPLSLLAGATGGYFGYKSQKPQWKSERQPGHRIRQSQSDLQAFPAQ